MSTPTTLLRRHPPFRRLFAATTGSAVGTYLAALALSVDVYDRTGSGRWLAALLVADFLPIILVGVALGPLIDRLQRRLLMIVADVTRLGVFAALPFVHTHPEAIVALAAVNGLATGFFRPAVWASVPNLVDDDDLDTATSLLSTVENAAWMVGPVISGLVIAVWSPSVAYGINAVSFLLSAVLIAQLSSTHLQSDASLSRGHWRDVRDGISFVRSSAPLVTVAIVWNTAAIGIACINVPEVVYAKEELGVGNVGFGILVGAMGLGLVIGSALAPLGLAKLGLVRVYGGSLLLMAVGFGAAAVAPSLAVAIPLVVIASAGNGCAVVCNQLLVQRGAGDQMRGRALAVLMSSYYAVLPIGMVLAGWLTDRNGARTTWLTGALIFLIAGSVAFIRTAQTRTEALTSLDETTSRPAQAPNEPAPVPFPAHHEASDVEAGVERMRHLLELIDAAHAREALSPLPARFFYHYARRPRGGHAEDEPS
jgi:MFS family permease